jgi:holo-[acyl-carrier protein] synthase
MITGIGIDLVDVERIRAAERRWKERLTNRLLGPQEQIIYQAKEDKLSFLSGRFAAKEAIVKCLSGFSEGNLPLRQIQIINNPDGRPQVKFEGSLKDFMAGRKIHLSITHQRQMAAAVAILVEKEYE